MKQRVLVFGLCVILLATPALAATYKIDPVHSSAIFKVTHFNVSNFYGSFNEVAGTIEYDGGNVGASAIEISISAASVDSRLGQRDDHIKSPDFLNAKQFPKITFKSKSVKSKDESMEITGELTMLGVSKEITITAEITGEGKHPRSGAELVGFEARFTVDRTAHDMNFMVGPVGKEIEFLISLEATKQ